jgi:hypothetical protein
MSKIISAELELGVPVTQRGRPNLRDFVPMRFIERTEALARGWSRYWMGVECRAGHRASRAVYNPPECSDCLRVRSGKRPIYPTDIRNPAVDAAMAEFARAVHQERVRNQQRKNRLALYARIRSALLEEYGCVKPDRIEHRTRIAQLHADVFKPL